MLQRFYIFIVVGILTNTCATQKSISGYYWRDFEGVIPEDAFKAGTDRSGYPVYIGQVLFDGKVVPGKIYSYERQIRFAWDNEKLSDKNIKILCSETSEQFQWVLTNSKDVANLRQNNVHLVRGGFEPRYMTYIGRAFQNGETVVGKLICEVNDCLGFYSPIDGKQVHDRNVFEALSFKK